MAAAITVSAADAPKQSILDGISIAPVVAYKQAGFDHGPSSVGAGIDLGLPVNKFVSIHVRNLAFEDNDQWGGSAVDETTLYGRADFASFVNQKLKLFGTGGGTRYWQTEEWGFGVGLGVEYRFTKNLSIQASEEVWALTKSSKEWLSLVGITWKF